MSPACGYLSLFGGKRSVLVSLAVFRGRPRPARGAFWAPLPSGSRAISSTAPSDSRVRRTLGSPPPLRCALPGLALPAARPRRPVTCRPWFGMAVFPAAAPVPGTVSSG
jgi:hypothetical protein